MSFFGRLAQTPFCGVCDVQKGRATCLERLFQAYVSSNLEILRGGAEADEPLPIANLPRMDPPMWHFATYIEKSTYPSNPCKSLKRRIKMCAAPDYVGKNGANGKAGSADHRFCGPRPFGLGMQRWKRSLGPFPAHRFLTPIRWSYASATPYILRRSL